MIWSLRCDSIRRGKVLSARKLGLWSNVTNFFEPKTDTVESLTLVDSERNVFRNIAGYSDKEYGGGSVSNYAVVEDKEDGKYMKWTGTMKFEEQHAVATKARGGFAALRFDCDKEIDLLDFEGFDIEIRSKTTLNLLFNMKCRSFIENDIHQLPFQLPANEQWTTLFAPFKYFSVTANGKEKAEFKDNDGLQLKSLGLLITSERCGQGDFEVDIRRIVATNK